MNVLNLDLDFFLNGRVAGWGSVGLGRPPLVGHEPWPEEAVRRFLEQSLNLKGKVPGKLVTEHHAVFADWRELIAGKRLKPPFFICHVDAHSDLGMGYRSWEFLHRDFLDLSLASRAFPKEGNTGINCGSFMAFAAGNRWFNKLDFVVPSCWKDDVPYWLLSGDCFPLKTEPIKADAQLRIELRKLPFGCNPSSRADFDFKNGLLSVGEPKIPFNIISWDSVGNRYQGTTWDYVYLSLSPQYVPKEADTLIPVISDYMML